MLKIGLTGGIASGKTTCANKLAKLGAEVHDADLIAQQLLTPGSSLYHELESYFGQELMQDRSKLRAYVFSNNSARLWLNAKMHPFIRSELISRSNRPTKYYHLLVVPLLFENNFDYGLSKTIVTISECQLERACERDKSKPEVIKKIMSEQLSNAQKVAKADFVVNTDLPNWQESLEDIHKQILLITK